jgi:hypothetical protein
MQVPTVAVTPIRKLGVYKSVLPLVKACKRTQSGTEYVQPLPGNVVDPKWILSRQIILLCCCCASAVKDAVTVWRFGPVHQPTARARMSAVRGTPGVSLGCFVLHARPTQGIHCHRH